MALFDAQNQTITPYPVQGVSAVPVSVQPGKTVQKFRYKNGGTFAQQQISAGPCTLITLWIDNTTGASAYVQLFDAVSANVTPGTTVPDFEYEINTVTQVSVPVGPDGMAFINGLTVFSSTASQGGTGSAAGVVVDAEIQ